MNNLYENFEIDFINSNDTLLIKLTNRESNKIYKKNYDFVEMIMNPLFENCNDINEIIKILKDSITNETPIINSEENNLILTLNNNTNNELIYIIPEEINIKNEELKKLLEENNDLIQTIKNDHIEMKSEIDKLNKRIETIKINENYTIDINNINNNNNINIENCSFNLKLFKLSNNKEKNIFISGLSLYIALGMLTNGAEKETLKELCDVLGNDIEKINKKIIKFLDLKFTSIEIANMIATKFDILDDFQSIMKKYKSEITNNLDLNYINDWCDKHTHGKIKKILDEISPNIMMILLNAIYFNNKWKIQFPKNLTKKEIFYGIKNKNEVFMMNIENTFKYVETEKEQIIELEYKDDNMSALIFLPKNENDINAYIEDLNDNKINELINQTNYVDVNLKLPKFKFEDKFILNDILKKMGIKKGFESNAEFGKISNNNNLSIDKVLQKTYLEIDEEKTEAAAVTAITIKATAIIPKKKIYYMNVNHPFLFFIRCNQGLEKNEQFIFMGKFEDLN